MLCTLGLMSKTQNTPIILCLEKDLIRLNNVPAACFQSVMAESFPIRDLGHIDRSIVSLSTHFQKLDLPEFKGDSEKVLLKKRELIFKINQKICHKFDEFTVKQAEVDKIQDNDNSRFGLYSELDALPVLEILKNLKLTNKFEIVVTRNELEITDNEKVELLDMFQCFFKTKTIIIN